MENRANHKEDILISAIASGDQSAFIELFNCYYSQLGHQMFALTGSLDLAEQAVQDAFIMAWLQKEFLVEIPEFWEYLFDISLIMANASVEEQRMRREGSLTGPSEHPLAPNRELVKQVVEQLPSLQKQVYVMCTGERLSRVDIGHLLDISQDQVKKITYDGLRFVRMVLSEYMPPCIVVVLTSALVLQD